MPEMPVHIPARWPGALPQIRAPVTAALYPGRPAGRPGYRG